MVQGDTVQTFYPTYKELKLIFVFIISKSHNLFILPIKN